MMGYSEKKLLSVISVLLVLCMLIVPLAGCGGKKTEETVAEAEEATTAAEAAATVDVDKYAPQEGKRYTITFVTNQLAPIDENPEMLQYWNEVFNVDLQLWNIDPTKWNEILNLKFAAGDIPDMIKISNMENLDNYYKQDLLAEIPDEVLYKYAPKICEKLESEYPGILSYGYQEGKRYGIPSEIRYSNIYRAPLVYRGDWLKKLGYSKTPETLEEFEEVMYAFARNDPDGNNKHDTYGMSKDGMSPVFGAFGVMMGPDWNSQMGYWLEKDGKLVCSSVEPGLKDALALLNKWYREGVLDPEFITGENTGGMWSLSHTFINGRIGFTTHGAYYHWIPALGSFYIPMYNTGEIYKKNPEAARSLVFGMPPTGPDGYSGVHQSNLFPGGYVGFGKQVEEEPDKMGKILQMIDYLCATSAENFAIAWYGIPGKHFNWSQWGVPEPVGKYQDTKELAKIGAHTIMLPVIIMEYLKWGEEQNQNPDAMLYKQWVKDNRFTEGGVVDKLVVTTPALNKYKSELVKLQAEAIISIVTGDKLVDYFETYVDNWRKAGGEMVEKEVNEWYASLKKN